MAGKPGMSKATNATNGQHGNNCCHAKEDGKTCNVAAKNCKFCDHHRCKGTTKDDRRCERRAGSNGYCSAHSDQTPVKTAQNNDTCRTCTECRECEGAAMHDRYCDQHCCKWEQQPGKRCPRLAKADGYCGECSQLASCRAGGNGRNCKSTATRGARALQDRHKGIEDDKDAKKENDERKGCERYERATQDGDDSNNHCRKASQPDFDWDRFWVRYYRSMHKTCEPGWVYIKIEEAHARNHSQAPRCKIGQSQKLEKRRIAGLVDHWSERVTNYKALELCVHDLLGDWRLRELSDVPLSGRTEWFELPVDTAVQAIKRAIVEGSGLFKLVPDEVTR